MTVWMSITAGLLSADFPALWTNPATPLRERKHMVRLLIDDVTIRRDKTITVHIRLKGGQHHTLTLPLPLASWQLRKTPSEVVAAIDELTEDHTDAQTAAILEQRGLTSGTGQPLHARLIRQIREAYQIPSHTQRLRAQGLLSLNEIARHLGVTPKTVKTWRDKGLLTGRRANDKGEYFYQLPDPNLPWPRIGRPPRAIASGGMLDSHDSPVTSTSGSSPPAASAPGCSSSLPASSRGLSVILRVLLFPVDRHLGVAITKDRTG